jgi:RimJ/RimL family protein N-acetyltransferase
VALLGARVLLRPLALENAPSLLEALDESREHFQPWLGFADQVNTLDACRDYIVRAQVRWLRGQLYSYGLFEPASGRLLGGTDLVCRDQDVGRFSIGYWLRATVEGGGYMTEAVRLVTRRAFDELGANRVEILCDARNARSAAVAERLGFRREGTLRGIMRARDGSLATMLLFARIPTDPRDFCGPRP